MLSYPAADLQAAILKTLVYANLFNYPLKPEEINQYLISSRKTTEKEVNQQLLELLRLGKIDQKKPYFFLKNRSKIVLLRKQQERWSKEKWPIAQKTAQKLSVIPSVKMIGITGTLAMNNCQKKDDIDLMIVTASERLWLTRLLVITLCPFLKINRRKKGETKVKDKICFNLFLEEKHLKITPQNLFLAHEIAQVKPIFDKDETFQKFLNENSWINKFLANTKIIGISQQKRATSKFLRTIDAFLFKLQYQYMKKEITKEKINLHQAFFHPNNCQEEILKKFEGQTALLGLDFF